MSEPGEWSCWQGGPHILLPEQVLHSWDGHRPPSDGRVIDTKICFDGSVPADYWRACDVKELIGAISVGDQTGLVIGDEVPMSTLTHHPDGSLVIFVPMTWFSENSFAIADLPEIVRATAERFVDTGIRFIHRGGAVALQPAVFPGDDNEEHFSRIMRPLAAGQYAVWTADTATDAGEFRAHWLRTV